MYENLLKKANFWAMKSCPKWNKNRLSRRWYRKKYRKLVKWYLDTADNLMRQRQNGSSTGPRDTYPWPYRDPNFASWPEDDDPENYTLVSDQSGCVVKYSTSYCAWKIYECTSKWPQKTSKERLDAKRWVQFLNEAGFKEVADAPKHGAHYVGVNPNEGEWGEVVWFEGIVFENQILVSTYHNKQYQTGTVDPSDYAWVKIA